MRHDQRLTEGLTRWIALAFAVLLATGPAAAQTGPPKPRVPFGRDPGGIAVAVIGAGIDYRRPEIAARLARDGEGEIIAWDVIDDDARPLEAAPLAGRRVPPQAGTAMTERWLAQTAGVRLIPVRVPDANPLALGGALAFVGQTPAQIAVLLVGGAPDPKLQSWQLFQDMGARARQLLLIVPAGHVGRDIDGLELRPASLRLPNLVVVTAASADGLVAHGASWGAASVDVAVAGNLDQLIATEADDRSAALENAAALRLAALAAGVAAKTPNIDGATLKARLLSLAQPMPASSLKGTRAGWIKP